VIATRSSVKSQAHTFVARIFSGSTDDARRTMAQKHDCIGRVVSKRFIFYPRGKTVAPTNDGQS